MVCFEKLSRMKINFYNSDMTPINMEESEAQQFAKVFYCKVGSFPFNYLGIPLHYDKLKREDLQPVVSKVMNRIPRWRARLMSYSVRVTLLKACSANLMPVIKFTKWALVAINLQMTNFFWNDQKNNHKHHLSNWQSLCEKKDQGGMGIPDLRDINMCLLTSWVQRYQDSGSKLWKEIIDTKYQINSPNVFLL
jgi:hypothetical protein